MCAATAVVVGAVTSKPKKNFPSKGKSHSSFALNSYKIAKNLCLHFLLLVAFIIHFDRFCLFSVEDEEEEGEKIEALRGSLWKSFWLSETCLL